jgi:glutathione synthase
MERILPPTHSCLLLKGGAVAGGPCAAELGVYGLFLGDGRTQALNVGAGHLLRAKMADVDEGGVVAGFAALSSPVLY